MGQQLTEQYRKAVGAIKEVLIFGAMLLQVEENFSTRGGVSGGRGKKGGLSDWLRAYAPEVPQATAWRFKALAEGVRDGVKMLQNEDLHSVLTAPEDQLSPRLATKREEIEKIISGKSQRQLLFEFGKASSSAGSTGSVQPRPIQPLSAEEKQQAFEERASAENIEFFNLLMAYSEGDKWKVGLPDTHLELARDAAEKLSERIDAWLKVPAKKRTAIDIEAELMKG